LPTLFELLHQSHDIQRSLCRQLTATRGNLARRELLFLQLKIELEAHAAAEERFVYCPILLTDAGLSVSRHALSEHHDIEELSEDLSVRDKAGDDWLATARELSEKVRHHLKEEEKKFFKVAGRILGDKQKALLARRYEKDVVRMRRKLAADYQKVGVSAAGQVQPAVS
jgi:Hemerythrin HHE cation binding domain